MFKIITKTPLADYRSSAEYREFSYRQDAAVSAQLELARAKYRLALAKLGCVPDHTILEHKGNWYVVQPLYSRYIYREHAGELRGCRVLPSGSLSKVECVLTDECRVVGYYDPKAKQVWSAYPINRPDDLDCAYIVIDEHGNEHRTHADLVDNDTVTGSIAAFIAVPNVIAFRKVT